MTTEIETGDLEELDDASYLRDLSERLRHVPVMYGVDDLDIGRLREIAKGLEKKETKDG